MKRESIGYRLYVKYNDAGKIRATEELLEKGYNGLVDSLVWKWAEGIIEDKKANAGKIRVNGYGESQWL